MQYLTADDTEVPVLGFGTWMMQGRECRKGVEDALSLGYRHIDTAQIYENEAEVGRALQRSAVSRDDIFLTTKVWRTNVSAKRVGPSIDESLRKLGTDYVDLLLIHWPVDEVPVAETLEAMDTAREAGKVRHLGVSNFTLRHIDEATSLTRVVTNQVECHPFLDQADMLSKLREHDMFLTAYSPLARGRVFEDDTLDELAETHRKSAAQIALRWLIQRSGVAAIPKASSPEHRRENLEIFDFSLSDDQMARIDGIARTERILNPDFAPQWDSAFV